VRIEVDDLRKVYGSTVAVDGLSFTAEPGRVTGFLGRNGAGKSTTMKVLVGLAAPSSGSATLDGATYASLVDPVRHVGTLLEHDAFHPARTARDHLRVVAVAAGIDVGRCDEVLAMVGLADDGGTRAGRFSLGMRQRLGLATALLGDPPVLVLDEPGNGLDPQGVRWLRQLLRWRADQGGTVLVSSHQLGEVQQLADDVVVIDGGRLLRSTVVAELAVAGVRVRAPALPAVASALRAAGGAVDEGEADVLFVTGLTPAAVGDAAFAAGLVLHELAPAQSSLEDAFVGLTGDEAGPS
jgi:ABC-2 type transport system ATP-binding protein